MFDAVKYDHKAYILFRKRTSGYFDIRTLDGEKVNKGSIKYDKLQRLHSNQGMLAELQKTTKQMA